MSPLWTLVSALVLAAEPQALTAPLVPATVSELHDRFIEAIENADKAKVVEELARTPADSTRDIQALFDLFMRFPDGAVRGAVLSSLDRMTFQSPELDVLLLHYLEQPESDAQRFAIKGAVRVRDPKALPLIERIASRKIAYKTAEDAVLLADRDAWWVQYDALDALARWKGEDALPQLVEKAKQAPEIARVMGSVLWRPSLPYFATWSASSSEDDQARARAGLTAPVRAGDLRATRDDMLKLLRDHASPKELRHQLAIKIGLCSTHEEAAALVKEYDAASDPTDKLMLEAAIFATRDEAAVPLLTKAAKESLDPRARSGALIELAELLGPEQMRPLYQWAVDNDPDPENRDSAADNLKLLSETSQSRKP